VKLTRPTRAWTMPTAMGLKHHPVRRNADPGASPFLDLCRTGGQHRLDIGPEGV